MTDERKLSEAEIAFQRLVDMLRDEFEPDENLETDIAYVAEILWRYADLEY